jgi:arylformamidase
MIRIVTRILIISMVVTLYPACQSHAGRLLDRVKERLQERTDDGHSGNRDSLSLPQGSVVKSDITYGPSKRQKIDVYIPPKPVNAPFIVMVHGGGWRTGDKAMPGVAQNKAAHWLAKGFILVSVNYRLTPEVNPLQQADDIASALRYIHDHDHEWGGNADRLILMGHSAGAHLSALLSSDPQRLARGVPRWQGTVVIDSAALDLVNVMNRRHIPSYDQAFGEDMAFWQAASPFHNLTAQAIPMQLVCSISRKDDPCGHARTFAQKAAGLGLRTPVLPVDKNHGMINFELGKDPSYTQAVDEFINSVL